MFGRLDPPGARGQTVDHAQSASTLQYSENLLDLVQNSSFANDGVLTTDPAESCSLTSTPAVPETDTTTTTTDPLFENSDLELVISLTVKAMIRSVFLAGYPVEGADPTTVSSLYAVHVGKSSFNSQPCRKKSNSNYACNLTGPKILVFYESP